MTLRPQAPRLLSPELTRREEEPVDCPQCGGDGYHTGVSNDPNRDEPCSLCLGTGKVIWEPELQEYIPA